MFIIEGRTAGVLAALATATAMVVLGDVRDPAANEALEPVAEIHEAVRSLAETGLDEQLVVARDERMDADFIVPSRL